MPPSERRPSPILIILPTYNERGNIGPLVQALLSLKIEGLHVAVLDDGSPDGTAEEALNAASGSPLVSVVHRREPRGRGLAGREGYLLALERGADALVEMDADLSHDPKDVPRLLAALEDCDVAIGSRLVPGGSDARRAPRRVLTALSCACARLLLGLPLRDANSGFRCFSRRALQAVEPATLRSRGPSIVHEVFDRAARAGLRMKEVSIAFAPRRDGGSKLTLRRLADGGLVLLGLFFERWKPQRSSS